MPLPQNVANHCVGFVLAESAQMGRAISTNAKVRIDRMLEIRAGQDRESKIDGQDRVVNAWSDGSLAVLLF